MQVRAAVATAGRAPLIIETIDLAEPRAGEVQVRLVASGLCHTDLIMIDHGPLPWSAVLGHEGVGVVERVGPEVTKLAPGDHVIMTTTGCGACATCRERNPSYCAYFEAINLGGGTHADEAARTVKMAGRCSAVSSANPNSPPMPSPRSAMPSRSIPRCRSPNSLRWRAACRRGWERC